MMSSDSQAMGRVGEVIIRTWQTAHKMKVQRGALPGDSERNDNARVKRYIAKYTINPAIARVWRAKSARSKPASWQTGAVVAGVLRCEAGPGDQGRRRSPGRLMGDPNASIPTPQPVHYRPMFGTFGRALAEQLSDFRFCRCARCRDWRDVEIAAVHVRGEQHTRRHRKQSMIHNDATPVIEEDAETYEVRANGVLLTCEPATVLPMAQRYFLF